VATDFEVYAPFDAGPGANVTEDTWRAMMRRGNIAGVARNVTNELKVIPSSGMTIAVMEGECVIESYWGQTNSWLALTVPSNATGSTRLDYVVARADWVLNKVDVDIVTGTASLPTLTRDTSKWEIPLAVLSVPNGAVTISSANILDARQWGGPPVMTVTDDFALYADRISTCRRFDVNADNSHVNTNLYISRMHSLGEQTVSQINMYPTVLPVAGTVQVRIFRGPRGDMLNTFIDPTTSTFLYGGSASAVHSSAIPVTTFRAGEMVVIAIRAASTTTAPSLATNVTSAGGGTIGNLTTPTANFVTGFKTAAMPTTLNIWDGSWNQRDRVFWCSLS
jgi:hypothetical protein